MPGLSSAWTVAITVAAEKGRKPAKHHTWSYDVADGIDLAIEVQSMIRRLTVVVAALVLPALARAQSLTVADIEAMSDKIDQENLPVGKDVRVTTGIVGA